jgi:DNA-binding SARP family transcriptional activator
MAALTIRLLGPPQVLRDGTPIEVDTRKAIALLAYLALREGPLGRDTLAGLLWPDYEPERARASLRRTLSALLKGLDGGFLVADRRAVRLEQEGTWLDVTAFRDLLRAADAAGDDAARVAHLTEAVGLYRGDFLAGFSVRDSPEFDDWQYFTAESLRREFAPALETLARACAAQGDLRAAIDHARRWSALDPLHEPAHRALMRLYAWSGQRGSALRQYRECVKILDRELGVPALEETHVLYRAIKENRLEAPRTAPPSSTEEARPVQVEAAATAAGPAALPLVGRDAEREVLLRRYGERGGTGWLAIVEGEVGIGKTRLVDDLAERIRPQATVVVVRCFEGEQQLPYGPFVAALRELLDDPGAGTRLGAVPAGRWADAGRLLPELAARAGATPATAPDDPTAQMRLLDAVTAVLLTGLSSDPPGLLVIDDAQWADSASLALLGYAVRRLAGRPVGVVLAWRSDAVPQGHPLRRLAHAGPGEATTLLLGRLGHADVDRLIDHARPETDADTRSRVWAETEGVPLFVVEYLAALSAGADLERWTLATGVRDLLATRLDGLGEAARQLLATAGVIGRSFDFATLRDTSGRGDEETVEGLEELLGHGLLREEPGERSGEPEYDFTHHQLRSVALEGASLARRRLLHRRVASVLAEQARGRRETAALRAQIAWHLQEAGDDGAAAEHYARAGAEARAVHANAEALMHFEAALALGGGEPVHLHAAVADLHTLAGRYDEAVRRYETAAALAGADDLPSLEHRLGVVHYRLGDWDLAEDHFRAALRLLDADGTAGPRARILADASLTAHRRGDAGHALELAGEALTLAEEADDPAALAQAHNLLGVLASSRAETSTALRHLERSLAVATGQDDLLARAGALNNLALVHHRAGSVQEALPLIEEAVELARRVGDRHRLAAAIGNFADLLHAAGRTPEAEARVREAVEILAAIGGDEPRPEIWKLTEW